MTIAKKSKSKTFNWNKISINLVYVNSGEESKLIRAVVFLLISLKKVWVSKLKKPRKSHP